jgi:hypothetical protein
MNWKKITITHVNAAKEVILKSETDIHSLEKFLKRFSMFSPGTTSYKHQLTSRRLQSEWIHSILLLFKP